MASYDAERVATWAWMMEDTASYTVGGGNAYKDSLDLLLATVLEKSVDPYALDAETLARINQEARYIVRDTLDIYAHDDAIQFEANQELAVLQGEA